MLSIFTFLLVSFAYSDRTFVQEVGRQELLSHGKIAYERRCAGCHGEKGDGNGPATAFLSPKPRDFTSGVYKFRSGELGTLPTDEDLMRVLERGVKGTSMPNFKFVPTPERQAIIEYIKTFSSAWKDSSMKGVKLVGAPYPKDDFDDFEKFVARAKKGKVHYAQECAMCHGLTGKGDGEDGQELTDEWGQAIRPANLRKSSVKSGATVHDLYRVLMSGIDGTPMPAFAESFDDPDELWNIVAWVLYQRGEEAGRYTKQHVTPITDEDVAFVPRKHSQKRVVGK